MIFLKFFTSKDNRFKIISLFSFLQIVNYGLYAQPPKLSGHITNLQAKEIIFFYAVDDLITTYDTVRFSNRDSFSVTFTRITRPTYITARCNRQTFFMFLAPGYDLKFQADGSRIKNTIMFSGKGMLPSHYLNYVSADSVVVRNRWRSDEPNCPNDCFFTKVERFRNVKDSILSFFDSTYNFNDPYWQHFVTSERINDRYTEISGLLNFSYINNRSFDDRESFYTKYIRPLLLSEDSTYKYIHLAGVKDYHSYLFFRYHQFDLDTAKGKINFEKTGVYGSYFKMASAMYRGKTRTVAMGRILDMLVSIVESQSLSIYPGRFIRIDSLINEYAPIAENKKFVELLKERYRKVESFSKFVPREYFSNLRFQDEAGREVSLSSFKGKTIYVDVWASWCGPCIEKFPKLKELQPQLDSSNVVLITINVDNDKKLWQQALGKYKPVGIQLYASDGLNGSFAKAFGVRSLPRYLLFNKAGHCINQFAYPPDHDLLTDALRKAN